MNYDYYFVIHPRAEDFSTPEGQPPVYYRLTFHYNVEEGQDGGLDEPSYAACIGEYELRCDDQVIDWPELAERFDMLKKDVMNTAYKDFHQIGHDD